MDASIQPRSVRVRETAPSALPLVPPVAVELHDDGGQIRAYLTAQQAADLAQALSNLAVLDDTEQVLA